MAYKLGKSECPYPSRCESTGYSKRREDWWAGWLESRTVSDEAKRKRRTFTGSLLGAVCAVILCCSMVNAQEVAAERPARGVTAIAPPPASSAPAAEVTEIRLGGLRKRIFSDRDAQQFRTEEEDVFAALEDAKEAGDITDEMSLVEKARVVFKRLQTKPENATAFAPLLKAKTREERLATVIKMAAAMKTIIRILENFESVFGEL